MKPTLLVLAAGMGSRYGGIKQMDAFGPSGETIIDYSIYDAIASGYGKIVFVIRESFAEEFKDLFEPKIAGRVKTEYVCQEKDSYLEGIELPTERSKPWGTAHAVLCGREVIHEPFAVINADDFYGKDAFEKSVAFLNGEVSPEKYCIIGYELGNTVSPNGSVSRGVCGIDENYNLIDIKERTKIFTKGEKIFYTENGMEVPILPHTPVSMNFWGFHPNVFDFIQEEFKVFLKKFGEDPKAEFFIPLIGDAFIHRNKGTIKVISTDSQWFGVTYKEDKPEVERCIRELVQQGVYDEKLWK